MPLMVPRSAFEKTYSPETGVAPGERGFHGPNLPFVSMAPRGSGLTSVAANVAGPAFADFLADPSSIDGILEDMQAQAEAIFAE